MLRRNLASVGVASQTLQAFHDISKVKNNLVGAKDAAGSVFTGLHAQKTFKDVDAQWA